MQLPVHLAPYGVVVCPFDTCRKGIPISSVINHYKRVHFCDEEALIRVEEIASAVGTTVTIPSAPIDAFEELAPPVDALRCIVNSGYDCQFISTSMDAMRHHRSEFHPGHTSPRGRPAAGGDQSLHVSIKAQRFFDAGPNASWFEVHPYAESPTPDQLEVLPILQGALETRQRLQTEAFGIIEDGAVDEYQPWLENLGWRRIFHGMNRDILVGLAASPKPSAEPLASRLVDVMNSTITHCFDVVRGASGTIRSIVNAVAPGGNYRPLEPYQDPPPTNFPAWNRVMAYIYRSYPDGRGPSVMEGVPSWSFSMVQSRAWDELARVLNSPMEETNPGSRLHDCSPIPGTERTFTEAEWHCLRFCVSLLDHQFHASEWESPLVVGTALLGVGPTGFVPPGHWSSMMSSILKCSRALVLAYCVEQAHRDASQSAEGPIQRCQAMAIRFLHAGTPTPMAFLQKSRNTAYEAAMNSTVEGRVTWLGDKLVYSDVYVDMADFKHMSLEEHRKLREFLFEHLLFAPAGLSDGVPDPRLADIRDNFANEDAGYSFLVDSRNQWIPAQQQWLAARVTSKCAGSTTGSWALNYLRNVKAWKEQLLGLTHITGGQPARGTEHLSIRYCNTPVGGRRNIMVDDGQVVFVTSYHKNARQNQSLKIIQRYLPVEVSELVIWYLTLVLPFTETLALAYRHELTTGDCAPPMGFHLFQDPFGPRWRSPILRAQLQRMSGLALGEEIGVAAYRQIAIAISKRYLLKDGFEDPGPDGDDDGLVDAQFIHEQSGHTLYMGESEYARGLSELSGLTSTRKEQFRRASHLWHKFLGFNPLPAKRGTKRALDLCADAQEAVMDRRLHLMRANLIDLLREVVGDDSATFRGKQEEALRAICSGASPVLVVSRTGGGKSMNFMLPAMIDKSGATIVVVPLVSLRQELLQRCQELRIRTAEWSRYSTPASDTAIVLVTPESVSTHEFMAYARQLHATGRLDRVVVDECHIALGEDVDYRPKLRNLGRLVILRVQLVLLTATLPPKREEELFAAFGCAEAQQRRVIRESTIRTNIHYAARRVRNIAQRNDEVKRLVLDAYSKRRSGSTVVYCRTVADVGIIASALRSAGVPFGEVFEYYAEAVGKDQILKLFMASPKAIMVCTKAFGLGNNKPDIRDVIHAYSPDSLLQIGQETGRGGRDGKPTRSVIVFIEQPTDYDCCYYLGGTACRRTILDSVLEVEEPIPRTGCRPGEEMCDVCRPWGRGNQPSISVPLTPPAPASLQLPPRTAVATASVAASTRTTSHSSPSSSSTSTATPTPSCDCHASSSSTVMAGSSPPTHPPQTPSSSVSSSASVPTSVPTFAAYPPFDPQRIAGAPSSSMVAQAASSPYSSTSASTPLSSFGAGTPTTAQSAASFSASSSSGDQVNAGRELIAAQDAERQALATSYQQLVTLDHAAADDWTDAIMFWDTHCFYCFPEGAHDHTDETCIHRPELRDRMGRVGRGLGACVDMAKDHGCWYCGAPRGLCKSWVWNAEKSGVVRSSGWIRLPSGKWKAPCGTKRLFILLVTIMDSHPGLRSIWQTHFQLDFSWNTNSNQLHQWLGSPVRGGPRAAICNIVSSVALVTQILRGPRQQ